ncbi:nicotinate phosphoribosyltransferase [Paenalcaligenes hominis]|uniref:Nicotinate phosphoribosyltransferase n=1 Tax=Paenalcaligenes hominis TaxID=643674 RepID=A0A1U9K2M6_9BURK|nr:phosphoribosyltransferase family protein [Paenalcaligenes hominis]AQS52295.1 nicotinate phosphoribosyltransferase [Paenalcaligenes hominis]
MHHTSVHQIVRIGYESAPNTDSDLWVSWDQYNELIEKLALQVHESGWKFDKIVCLARGGMRVGDVISRIYDVPLGILATSSYREAAGTEQGSLDIAQFITITRGTLDGNVLLIDDMVDTGMTFKRVRDHLRTQFPAITELRTGVLWWKGHSTVTPDYYVEQLPTNPWIHQPFEDYDTIRPQQLEAWIRKGKSTKQED